MGDVQQAGLGAEHDQVVENIASSVTDEKQLAAIDTVFGAMKDAKALPFQWTSDMATYMTQQIALAVNGEADAKTQLEYGAPPPRGPRY